MFNSSNSFIQKYRDSLPPTQHSFFLPRSDAVGAETIVAVLVDQTAIQFLPGAVNRAVKEQNTAIVPLKTEGDGNCLPRAVSRGLWGSEYWHAMLREGLHSELVQNEEFYRPLWSTVDGTIVEFDDEDWRAVLEQAATLNADLQMIHVHALSHVIRRPILVYASDGDVETFGAGGIGVSATFFPARLNLTEVASMEPVAIAWADSFKKHFVPLVGVEGYPAPVFPLPMVAYPDMKEKVPDYVKQEGNLLDGSSNEVLRHLKDTMASAKTAKRPVSSTKRVQNPLNGKSYDKMMLWEDRLICFNYGDDLLEVATNFVAENQLSPSLIEPLYLSLKRHAVPASEREGAPTLTPSSICACGFKHRVKGVEYDFASVLDVERAIGWNLGDSIIDRVDEFLRSESMLSPLRSRGLLCQAMVMKEVGGLRRQHLRRLMEADDMSIVTTPCVQCGKPCEHRAHATDIICRPCAVKFSNKNLRVATCINCAATLAFSVTKEIVECPSCKYISLHFHCKRCDAFLAGGPEVIAVSLKCTKCDQPVDSSISDVEGQYAPARALFSYRDADVPRIVLAFIKHAKDAISAADVKALESLASKAAAFESSDISAESQALARCIASVPNPFPALDLHSAVLLHPGVQAAIREKDPQAMASFKLILDSGWSDSSDWKCHFAAMKCLTNLFLAFSENRSLRVLLLHLDDVLTRVELTMSKASAANLNAGHQALLVAAASAVVLNFSCVYLSSPEDTMGKSQLAMQLMSSFLPSLIRMRRTVRDDLKASDRVDEALTRAVLAMYNLIHGDYEMHKLSAEMADCSFQDHLMTIINEDAENSQPQSENRRRLLAVVVDCMRASV